MVRDKLKQSLSKYIGLRFGTQLWESSSSSSPSISAKPHPLLSISSMISQLQLSFISPCWSLMDRIWFPFYLLIADRWSIFFQTSSVIWLMKSTRSFIRRRHPREPWETAGISTEAQSTMLWKTISWKLSVLSSSISANTKITWHQLIYSKKTSKSSLDWMLMAWLISWIQTSSGMNSTSKNGPAHTRITQIWSSHTTNPSSISDTNQHTRSYSQDLNSNL